VSATARIITLTTDFGRRDPFVGIMKGVILGICRDVQLVDLTHEIAPHDVLEGALALEAASHFFPSGSIHVAVVDPGVGSARRAIAVRAGGHFFVGPDNGIFTSALLGAEWSAVSLEAAPYRLPEVSQTFHGRDIFAPAAGHLASGVSLEDLGPHIADPERLVIPEPTIEGDAIVGEVIASDRFGNLVTSLTAECLGGISADGAFTVELAGRKLGPLVKSYEVGGPGAPSPIIGSGGRLEVFVKRGNAHAILGVGRGARVRVRKT